MEVSLTYIHTYIHIYTYIHTYTHIYIGAWSDWDACNATCGGGSQFKTFTISVPQEGFGEDCGPENGATETQICNTDVCSVNCEGTRINIYIIHTYLTN